MKPNPYFITTLDILQEAQYHFCVLNNFHNTIAKTLKLLICEIGECEEALLKNDKKQITGELADILIFTATIANINQINLNMLIQNELGIINTSPQLTNLIKIRKFAKTYELSLSQIKKNLTNSTDNIRILLSSIVLCIFDLADANKINLNEALTNKITRNYIKYNPYIRKQLIQTGITPGNAYKQQKNSAKTLEKHIKYHSGIVETGL